MIFHVCSHFGDIELLPYEVTSTLVRFSRLTPTEKVALERLIAKHPGWVSKTPILEFVAGELLLTANILDVAQDLGHQLHPGSRMITAVRFADAKIKVTRDANWAVKLFGFDSKEVSGVPLVRLDGDPPAPKAAVQVTMPEKGCPMPTATELKEAKAAAVVRKFLDGQQAIDFDNHRAFVAIGNHTGHMYRLTSRWNPECERLGVLRDIDEDSRICASNLDVPPSEEILSMKFAIENWERSFRGLPL